MTHSLTSLCIHPFPSLPQTKEGKKALPQQNARQIVHIRSPYITYNNSLQEPIKETRFSLQSSAYVASLVGSTFFTNKEEYLNARGHTLLDAAYGMSYLNTQGEFKGFSLGLGDGAGGHFGDSFQDEKIARAAYTNSKWAARFLGAYDTPDQLKEEMVELLPLLKQRVIDRGIGAEKMGESSTLLACRLFHSEASFRCIGFNIGDGLAFSWDPQAQTIHSLLPSSVTEAGTALFPEPYNSFEIATIDTTLSEGAYLFLLSDGVHDLLPHLEEAGVYPNGLKYRTRELHKIKELFSNVESGASPSFYLKILRDALLERAETTRQSACKSQERGQWGDDALAIGCMLAASAPENTFTSKIKNFLGV